MARITEVALKRLPQHHVLTVRKTIDFMRDYAALAHHVFEKTNGYLQEQGLVPISGPITCFHNTELVQLDTELGWQVAHAVKGRDDMVCRFVPEQTVVSAIDQGPYEEQDPTLMDVLSWAEANGYTAQGPITYCYLNDTQRPAAQYLTQMFLPVS